MRFNFPGSYFRYALHRLPEFNINFQFRGFSTQVAGEAVGIAFCLTLEVLRREYILQRGHRLFIYIDLHVPKELIGVIAEDFAQQYVLVDAVIYVVVLHNAVIKLVVVDSLREIEYHEKME